MKDEKFANVEQDSMNITHDSIEIGNQSLKEKYSSEWNRPNPKF
jgi:hypothetical protein